MTLISKIARQEIIKHKNQPWLIINITHHKPGKGRAFYFFKLKNLQTGTIIEERFNTNQDLETLGLDRKKAQFLYTSDDQYCFMDLESYEQFNLTEDQLGATKNFLQAEKEYTIMYLEDKPLQVLLPPKIDLQVTEAEPAVKGDTATNALKPVTVETGYKVMVPLFINQGDTIRINTESGEYCERAN